MKNRNEGQTAHPGKREGTCPAEHSREEERRLIETQYRALGRTIEKAIDDAAGIRPNSIEHERALREALYQKLGNKDYRADFLARIPLPESQYPTEFLVQILTKAEREETSARQRFAEEKAPPAHPNIAFNLRRNIALPILIAERIEAELPHRKNIPVPEVKPLLNLVSAEHAPDISFEAFANPIYLQFAELEINISVAKKLWELVSLSEAADDQTSLREYREHGYTKANIQSWIDRTLEKAPDTKRAEEAIEKRIAAVPNERSRSIFREDAAEEADHLKNTFMLLSTLSEELLFSPKREENQLEKAAAEREELALQIELTNAARERFNAAKTKDKNLTLSDFLTALEDPTNADRESLLRQLDVPKSARKNLSAILEKTEERARKSGNTPPTPDERLKQVLNKLLATKLEEELTHVLRGDIGNHRLEELEKTVQDEYADRLYTPQNLRHAIEDLANIAEETNALQTETWNARAMRCKRTVPGEPNDTSGVATQESLQKKADELEEKLSELQNVVRKIKESPKKQRDRAQSIADEGERYAAANAEMLRRRLERIQARISEMKKQIASTEVA